MTTSRECWPSTNLRVLWCNSDIRRLLIPDKRLPTSLLQASNLDYLRGTAQSLPYRRSVLTMWIRVPPKKRGNPTMSAVADFGDAFRQEMRERGILSTLRDLAQIYSR